MLLTVLLLSGICYNAGAQIGYYDQAYQKQYLLAVNEQATTVLIFPSAIVQNGIDRGAASIIAKQVDGVPNILKVKAAVRGFQPTNLTVITAAGQVYSYAVVYSEYPDTKPIDMGKEQRQEAAVAFFKNRKLNATQIRSIAQHMATRKPFMRNPRAKSFGIRARLKGIYITEDVVFYRVELSNKTQIDYATDFMRFYIRDKKRIKRTASQEEELEPLYVFREHGEITAGKTRQTLVIAFPKFTVADHKNFVLQIFEKNGDRNINLKISGNAIAHAEKVPFNIKYTDNE